MTTSNACQTCGSVVYPHVCSVPPAPAGASYAEKRGVTTYYKVLNKDGTPCHGGHGKWHLPNGRPGKWMPPIKRPRLCERGYHVLTAKQLLAWLGPAIFTVEVRGEHQEDDRKSVWSEARLLARLDTWNERTARLFAADCAERVLTMYEHKHPNDDRPRKAIKAARLAAASPAESARSAAWSAARSAWNAAGSAAQSAAGSAAEHAAWSAWSAARSAERIWQSDRLAKYLSGKIG